MSNNYHIGSLIGSIKLGITHKKEYILVKKTKNTEILLKFFFKKNLIKNYLNYKKKLG